MSFPIGQSFKLGVGVTSNEFVVAANGQHILQHPFGDDKFLGEKIDFQISLSDGLELKIHGVDFVVYEVAELKKPVDTIQKERISSPIDADKQLARIFHH